jgi:hypothetical protein
MYTAAAARPVSSPRKRWFLLGLGLVFVVLSVQYYVKAAGNGERVTRSAFLRWRDQLSQLRQADIYEQYNYPNPPIMALALKPLAQLPPLVGSLCWFYLKLGLTWLALLWVFRLVETPDRPFPEWAKALTILLSLRPIMGDLSHGNVNLFILFLVIAALYAFHRGRDWTAGVTMALAMACKVTPTLFIPYFLWKRAWKALAGCLVGLLLFLVIVPGCFLGQQRNLTLLGSWVDRMIVPFVVDGAVTSDHLNQSLPGLVFRLGTHNPSVVDDKGTAPQFDNLANLDPRQAGWIIKGFMALFAGCVVWACRTPLLTRQGWRLSAEFSLVVLGMLLFSERTWKHHCVTLVFPFAVLSYYLAVCRPGPVLRAYLIGSLVAVVLLMTTTSTTGIHALEVFDEAAKRAQVYGAYVWAYLVLVAALVVLLRCKDRQATARIALDTDVIDYPDSTAALAKVATSTVKV